MIMPYLSFDGTCEEAFRWYQEIFGGRIQHLSKYGDIPDHPAMPISGELKTKVMHAQMMLTESGGISGADTIYQSEQGSRVSIHAHMECETMAESVFRKLSEGGTVIGQLATNPPPDESGVSGSVKDRFGFVWIISAMKD